MRAPFKGARQTTSTEIRSQRLPEITGVANTHSFGGLGLHGLDPYGFGETDSSYLLFYAELGVVGLAAFVALLIVVLVSSAQGLRAPPSWGRLLAAGAVGGIVAGLLGSAAFDLFSLPGSAHLFWVIAAIGVVTAERNGAAPLTRRWSWRRLAIVPVGVGIGVVLAFAVPSHAAVVTPFDSLPLQQIVRAPNVTGGAPSVARPRESTCLTRHNSNAKTSSRQPDSASFESTPQRSARRSARPRSWSPHSTRTSTGCASTRP